MKLADKVAIVTGGGGAIGRAIALKLAAAGADVAVVDANTETAEQVAAEVRALGRRGHSQTMDIRSYETVTTGVDAIVERFGRLDIVVNSAGGSARSRMGRFESLDIEVFDWILDVNLRGPMYIIRAALPHLIQRNAGKIVNIASIVALGGKAGCVDYSAAKGGILAATKSLAIEVGKYNINVNCVSPGLVQRPDQMPADEAAFAKRHSYLNRICTQDDVAEAVLYLASPESDFVTGQNVVVDGGRSLGLRGD